MSKEKDKTAREILKELEIFPPQILLETTSHCNLNCSMCARQFKPKKWGTMKEELARKVIDEVIEKAPSTRMWFCYLGEPLLMRRKGLFERIRYAKMRGLKQSALNTNGTLMDKRCVKEMIDSGLDEVYIGVDATDSETYNKIRIGGDFKKLIENIHYLMKEASNRIKITVQIAELEENAHQIEEFKKYWSQFPVNIFVKPRLTWTGYVDNCGAIDTSRYACAWKMDCVNVNHDGSVPYCVADWGNRRPFGNVNEESIFDIWQKKIFPYLIVHAKKQWGDLPDFCQKCVDWKAKPPKDKELMKLIAKSG